MNYPALESDPCIFTNYFRSVGLSPSWDFSEVYSMDYSIPASAVILAYRSTQQGPIFEGSPVPATYFIKQVGEFDAACGLLAAVHAIFNIHADLKENSLIQQLKDNIHGKSPSESAEIMLAMREIKEVHQEYAAEGQTAPTNNNTTGPTHHFVTITPGFILYDGGKESPIQIDCQGDDLCAGLFEYLKRKIADGIITEDINLMVLRQE